MKVIFSMCLAGLAMAVTQSVTARGLPVTCDNPYSCYQRTYQPTTTQYQHRAKPVMLAYRGNSRGVFPRRIAASGQKMFVFSPRHRAWAAYDGAGNRVGYGKANGGASYCADVGRSCLTPRGVFRVRSKGTAACKSSKFPRPRGGAPMPYCMFFHGGYAIHGSPSISNNNSSHGCIRVRTSAARWLHQNFMSHGTKVVVLSY